MTTLQDKRDKQDQKLQKSISKLQKLIDKQLDVIRDQANDHGRTFEYQTALYTFKNQIEKLK